MTMAATGTKTETTLQEYAFSDADFAMIAEMANRKYGLYLQESKKALVYSRLARRLRALSMESFKDYCALLENPECEAEQSHLLSALTTNVTHFFRERHHFDQLRTEILPRLAEKARAGQSVRLWSSACSAGQEAYCMAAMVIETIKDAKSLDIRVLATDVDPVVIEKGRAGLYALDQLDAIPAEFREVMVETTKDAVECFKMRAELRQMVSFAQLNLIGDWPMKRHFDVIFCRNAAIYFDKQTQARLWQRFSQILAPQGYLMIGHSERLSGDAAQFFRSSGITSYQKRNTTG